MTWKDINKGIAKINRKTRRAQDNFNAYVDEMAYLEWEISSAMTEHDYKSTKENECPPNPDVYDSWLSGEDTGKSVSVT